MQGGILAGNVLPQRRDGYDWPAIGKALLAIGALGAVLNGMAVAAFRAQGR